MSDFYINRKLHSGEQIIEDSELLHENGVFVVLAEPGAGKTDLLDFFSEHHKVARERASIFVHSSIVDQKVLIIDALDEVSRINEEKINEIIVKARETGAEKIVFASRSYVWDEARNTFIRDCFGVEPRILRLEPFDEQEQHQLFLRHMPDGDFKAFSAEAKSFELTPLLGNPQFLNLFIEAYIESDGHFTSKLQIYADALQRLSSENEQTASLRDRPQADKIIDAAGEVFAKLLLSGAVGISTTETLGDDDYPYLLGIGSNDSILTHTLNTRLFKPTSSVNRHEPIHRIIAEYCAANYLVKLIENPINTFSIRRCFSIIAPNSAVRAELRGLLGWMAALGGPLIQESVIDLDPYAVFANGDPSQLTLSSKQKLLRNLEKLASIDPYFRRMDSWRKFNASGFFTEEIVQDVRPLLAIKYSNSHLRELILELLNGSKAATQLQSEFRLIMHDPDVEQTERRQAYQNLNGASKTDCLSDFDLLTNQGAYSSLKIASDMVLNKGCQYFGMPRVLQLIKTLAQLYPENYERRRQFEPRYFIKELINKLDIKEIVYLLNEITSSIKCTCKKKEYQCVCRKGISKICGHLLDRYCDIMMGPYDPKQIFRWIKPLVFRSHINAERSSSVQALRSNSGVRQAIYIDAFSKGSNQDEMHSIWVSFAMSQSHSGLSMYAEDIRKLVDHAIEVDNKLIWEYFIAVHNPYAEPKGANELRTHMRNQARQSDDLLRIWARVEKNHKNQLREQRVKYGRSNNSYKKREAKIREKNLESLQQDRSLIEAGQHWGWLKVFAQQYLYKPDKVEDLVDDPEIIEKALLNCFDFLTPHIPTLEMLADQQGLSIAMVLEAACLITYRQRGSLDAIPINILQAVKAQSIGGDGYQEGEVEAFELEIDRLIFSSDAEIKDFLKAYLEPQFNRADDSHTRIYMLDHGNAFAHIKGEIALDWLTRYPNMPSVSRDTLFNIAVAECERSELNNLINDRCNDPIDISEAGKKRRQFWLLRHFFFIAPTSETVWAEFSKDPQSIFAIENYSGRMSRDDNKGWPQLNAKQIYLVLDSYVLRWPKVDLPNSWGTGDPDDERAYRFLSDIIYQIGRDAPSESIPVFDKILSEDRFCDFHDGIKSQKVDAIRQLAHAEYQPPRPTEISKLLNESKISSVEDMRAVLIETLDEIQSDLKGAATNPVDVFYSGDSRVDENTARNRIVEMFQKRLSALNMGVVVEHQMRDAKRCDFTASTSIDGSQAILVTEVKGQWHKELYTAASAQLAERYMIYPGAADQGVYLVLWFGNNEDIAGKKEPSIDTAEKLRNKIISSMPKSLIGRIDVYVLDVSKNTN